MVQWGDPPPPTVYGHSNTFLGTSHTNGASQFRWTTPEQLAIPPGYTGAPVRRTNRRSLLTPISYKPPAIPL